MTLWLASSNKKLTFQIDSKGNIDKTTKDVVRLIRSKNKEVIYLNGKK